VGQPTTLDLRVPIGQEWVAHGHMRLVALADRFPLFRRFGGQRGALGFGAESGSCGCFEELPRSEPHAGSLAPTVEHQRAHQRTASSIWPSEKRRSRGLVVLPCNDCMMVQESHVL